MIRVRLEFPPCLLRFKPFQMAKPSDLFMPQAVIYVHACYRTAEGVRIEGRYTKVNSLQRSLREQQSFWLNLWRIVLAFFNRFSPSTFYLTADSLRHPIEVDQFGEFKVNLSVSIDHLDELRFEDETGSRLEEIPSPQRHCFFPERASLLVLSDIDDTILVSDVIGSLFRRVLLLATHPYQRLEVDGMSSCYQHLHQHGSLLAYVSNSQAVLYPFLQLFLTHRAFPAGPLFLRPYRGIRKTLSPTSEGRIGFKQETIERLMEQFPNTPCLLVGDSGQNDLEVYTLLALAFPQQVKAVCIRQLKEPFSPKAQARIASLEEAGIVFISFSNGVDLQDQLRSISLP